jgi:YVTN family beta-propeller protein
MSLPRSLRRPSILSIGLLVVVLMVSGSAVIAGHAAPVASVPTPVALASSSHAAEHASEVPTLPVHPAGAKPGYVFNTVVPWNSTVVPGNFLAISAVYPQGIAYDPSNGYMYVISDNGALVVWDPATDRFVKSIPLTDYATALALDLTDSKLFVLTEMGYNLTVIDTTTLTVIGSITVGANPYNEVWDYVNDELFVSNLGGTNVTIVNAATDQSVGQFAVGSTPQSIAFDAAANDILLMDSGNGGITVYNVTQGIVTSTITAYGGSSAFAVDMTDHLVITSSGTKIWVLGAGTLSPIRTFVDPGATWFNVSATGHVYGVDEYSDQVTIFDAANLATPDVNLTVGNTPFAAAYDPATGDVYVTNQDSGNISVLSDTSLTITATDALSFTPKAIAYDATHEAYYVAASTPSLLLVNATTHVVIGSVNLPITPTDLLDVPSLNELWISGDDPGHLGWVVVLDETTLTVVLQHFTEGVGPMAFDATDGIVCLANSEGNVTLLAPATADQIASVPLPLYQGIYWVSPDGVVWDPANDDLYLTDGTLNNTVTVVNVPAEVPVHWIGTGSLPYGITLDPTNGLVYVTDRGATALTVITPSTQSATGAVNVGINPEGIAYDALTGYLYVADWGSNNVSVIDPTTQLQVVSLPVGAEPLAVASATAIGNISVANEAQGTISLIGIPGAAVNTLVSVAITPDPGTVQVGNSASFSATPTCSLGACPGGTTYTWSLTNGLATLGSPTGSPVSVTAGATAGFDGLFVNATLSGTTVEGGPDIVTITTGAAPTLASVSVSPTPGSVQTGNAETFTASVACTGGPCPAGSTYSWTLTNGMGTLSPTATATEIFTAGSTPGLDNLFVNATLNSVTVQSIATPITITAPPPPVLSGVTISPSGELVFPSSSNSFTASITCAGGACPAGATYSWTLTNTLGTLTATTTATETFNAGTTLGEDNLFVNATLNSVTVQSAPAFITIAQPYLTFVTTDPTAATIYTGATQSVTALLTCEGGNPCPAGATFSWTATNGLGTLTSATSVTVTFTAGSSPGVDTLFVNATFNSVTIQSSPCRITVILPTLASVTVTPSSASVDTGATQSFAASITCTGGTCPSGVSYAWTLSSALGSLGSSTGTPVVFTAGSSTGTLTIMVTATLNGNTASGSSSITIVTAPGGGGGNGGGAEPKLFGLPQEDAYGLLAGLGLVVAGMFAFFAIGMRRRKNKDERVPAKKEEKSVEEEAQEDEENSLLSELPKSPETPESPPGPS